MPKIPDTTSIGNTTFRRPWRVPAGLRVLEELISTYPFKNKTSSEFEKELDKKLIETGVKESDKPPLDWNGRKFLANCTQYGFIATRPNTGNKKYKLNDKEEDENLKKILNQVPNIKMKTKPFSLTPLGVMFKNTESNGKELTAEQKDIFLKALFHHKQPSPAQEFSSSYKGETFYPLKLYIDILLDLVKGGMDAWITPGEMAAIINTYKTNNIKKIIKEIKEYRSKFKLKKGKEKTFARIWFKNKKRGGTFGTSDAYQDINITAPINTGLFKKRGKKLILKTEEKHKAKLISNYKYKYNNEKDYEYLQNLWSGKLLPFEDKNLLVNEASKIKQKLYERYNIKSDEKVNKKTDDTDLKKIYYTNKDKYTILQEHSYYEKQKNKAPEIIKILKNIQTPKREIEIDKEIIKAESWHLEWILWRVFLAINSFNTKVQDTRNFSVDDNFVATSHAISGVEDMFFEFDDYVLIVEPSFKTGRAQIKDEDEPVFNHTWKKSKKFPKKTVYTLFVGNGEKIELNLVHHYKNVFYAPDEKEFYGNIIPMTISQITGIFEKLFHIKKTLNPISLKEIMDECLADKENLKPTDWREKIKNVIELRIN